MARARELVDRRDLRARARLPDVQSRPFDPEEQVTAPWGPVLKGRYVLGVVLGEGGMAIVHRAVEKKTGRAVAVKVLRPGTGIPNAAERFEREVRLMASIQHPHCVRLLDAGTEPTSFAVLELIEGRDLRSVMRRQQLPAAQVLEYTLQLFRALQAVHAQGIIHRDIKAENIMLTRTEAGTDRLVLVDFGAAIRSSASQIQDPREVLTGAGQLLGTPTAMSPELFRGKRATEQSDLYAVGVLMYEMLAGRAPFAGGDFTEVLAAKTKPLPPIPRAMPQAVAWLLHSLLSADPEQRPESCEEAIEVVMYTRDVLRQDGSTNTWFDLLSDEKP